MSDLNGKFVVSGKRLSNLLNWRFLAEIFGRWEKTALHVIFILFFSGLYFNFNTHLVEKIIVKKSKFLKILPMFGPLGRILFDLF
jgi:hypothetical protein